MADVSLNQIRKSFGAIEVIKGVDLDIRSGEFVVFVGPSGCGKSTLLRMIAGLEDITSGSLSIGGTDMTDEDPAKRGIAMVFQTYALYPHMTVRENMGFALRFAGMKKQEIETRVMDAAKMLELESYLDRKPKALSGGQRQRVAIGRAIVRNPKIFLFDEPLSNLDAELRVRMRLEIARLHEEIGATMVYVTHDQVEAMTLATKIVVLRDGNIEQVGAPIELYNDPDNMFVAGFIGSPRMNIIDATAGPSGSLSVGGQTIVVDPPAEAMIENTPVRFGIRPEHLAIGENSGSSFEATVDFAEYLGGTRYLYCRLPDGQDLTVEQREGEDHASGERIWLTCQKGCMRLFSPDGERLR